MYTIGKAAQLSEIPVKTIRYYHDIGFVEASATSDKGYRLYTEQDIQKLIFVRHARAFGFSIDDCRELLSLYQDPSRQSKEVKQKVTGHLKQIKTKMQELQRLYDTLEHLAENCHGDDRPDCPIIDFLAKG